MKEAALAIPDRMPKGRRTGGGAAAGAARRQAAAFGAETAAVQCRCPDGRRAGSRDGPHHHERRRAQAARRPRRSGQDDRQARSKPVALAARGGAAGVRLAQGRRRPHRQAARAVENRWPPVRRHLEGKRARRLGESRGRLSGSAVLAGVDLAAAQRALGRDPRLSGKLGANAKFAATAKSARPARGRAGGRRSVQCRGRPSTAASTFPRSST